MLVSDIFAAIDSFAPFIGAKEGDNCGLTVGRRGREVTRALVTLDVTRAVLDEAARVGAELVVSHHPLIYSPLRSIADDSLALLAAERGIALIAAHTNLDVAPGGLNDTYINLLGFTKLGAVDGTSGCAALTRVEKPMSARQLASIVMKAVGARSVRYADGGKPIQTVGVCCGGGASFLQAVLDSGADAFVTGDIKYSAAVDAARCGVTTVNVGHYETERIILAPLAERLAALCPGVEFTLCEDALVEYLTDADM